MDVRFTSALPTVTGHGHRAWSPGMVTGHGHRAWSPGMVTGHGHRAWSVSAYGAPVGVGRNFIAPMT